MPCANFVDKQNCVTLGQFPFAHHAKTPNLLSRKALINSPDSSTTRLLWQKVAGNEKQKQEKVVKNAGGPYKTENLLAYVVTHPKFGKKVCTFFVYFKKRRYLIAYKNHQ